MAPQKPRIRQFCILCAKADEHRQIVPVLAKHFDRKRDLGGELGDVFYVEGASGNRIELLATTCLGMGDLSAAVAVADVLRRYNPTRIALVGTAASLDPSKVQLGDVVIPEKAIARGYDKITEKGQAEYEARHVEDVSEKFFGDNLLCALLDTAWPPKGSGDTMAKVDLDMALGCGELVKITVDGTEVQLRQPRIHTDVEILSCGMVVDSITYRDFLLKVAKSVGRKGSAIDMESYGFWKSLSLLDNPVTPHRAHGVIIRGISDYAGRKAQTEARPEGWKNIAVKNAAEVAVNMFKGLREQF